MTQAISNKLNNLEEMLMNNASKLNEAASFDMDKKTDFRKVLDSKLDKSFADTKTDLSEIKKTYTSNVDNTNSFKQKKTYTEKESGTEEVKTLTLEDLKTIVSDGDNSKISAGFREILAQITEEANVETSLDLTLARDINEIISQLKEAVANATETIEKNKEEIVVILPVDENSTSDLEEIEIPTEENEIVDTENRSQIPFEQILTFVDNKATTITKDNSNQQILNREESQALLEFIDTTETTQAETIELADGIINEIASSKKEDSNQAMEVESLLDEDALQELNIESLSAETETSSEEGFMQNQTPEENALKAMINAEPEIFEGKIEANQSIQSAQPKPTEISPSRILDQITKHLENLHSNSKVNIVLNPESLGKVNIQLLTTKEGLAAQFTVTTQETRDLLMKGLDGLKETLTSHGVGVDNVSVKVADTQKSEYKQDWTEQEGSRGGNKGQGQPDREEKEKGLFEKMMAQRFEEENGNV